MTHRYAIYFTPPADHELTQFGAAWLGRNAFTGEAVEQSEIEGIEPARLREITASPRRYGFHATLKAPFRLADGRREEELIAALDAFASRISPFAAPPVELANLYGFWALVLDEPSAEMADLAARCVREFDDFRAPLTPEEIARRKPERLSERARGQLMEWGYPHIFEDFLFHMTLTDRLTDAEEIAIIESVLDPVVSVFRVRPLEVDGIGIYRQDEPGGPFVVAHRAVFTG